MTTVQLCAFQCCARASRSDVLVLTRSEVQAFTDKQIELVTTYADQAAIAIENVRLFEVERERTHELTKSLETISPGSPPN